MANIQNCPKTALRYNEWLTFCVTIRDEMKNTNFDISPFKAQYDTFDACIIQFENSINRLNKSIYTKKMKDQKRRLNASRDGLFKKIVAELSSSKGDFVAAATNLKIVIDKFRNISALSFENIISLTDSIISYFESDEYKNDIELLSLTNRVNELKISNDDSKKLLAKKMIETGSRNMIRKSSVTLRELMIAYNKLVDELNFISRRDGDAKYISLFAFWNALIDKVRVSISLRKNLSKGGKTDGGISNTPNPPIDGSGSGNGGSGNEDDRPVID